MLLAVAQQPAAAPGQKQAENALDSIGQYGAVGSICVLALIALFLAIRGWLREKDGRLADQKAMTEERRKDNDALKTLTIELKEHSAQLVLDARTSQDSMASTLARQENAFDDLNRTVAALQSESAKTTAQVEQLKNEQVRFGAQLAVAGNGRQG